MTHAAEMTLILSESAILAEMLQVRPHSQVRSSKNGPSAAADFAFLVRTEQRSSNCFLCSLDIFSFPIHDDTACDVCEAGALVRRYFPRFRLGSGNSGSGDLDLDFCLTGSGCLVGVD